MEIVDGPQRITWTWQDQGKTIVLALKAAYLHAQNPDWNIVNHLLYTFSFSAV